MPQTGNTVAYLTVSSNGQLSLNWAGTTWSAAIAFGMAAGTFAASKQYHVALTYDPSAYTGSTTTAPDLNASGVVTWPNSGGAQTNSDLKFYIKNITDSGSWSLPNFNVIEDNWEQSETQGTVSSTIKLGPQTGGGSATAIQFWNTTLTSSDLP